MVKEACPDPDGMKKFKNDWKKKMHSADTAFGIFCVIDTMELSIVSIILPSWVIIKSPLASPITNAAVIISLAPNTKASIAFDIDIL
ncbi:hypothetical protein D3C87_1754740 [compost metagenome]